MTQIKPISYTTVRDCGAVLMAEYNAECGWPDVPANPQWHIYEALETSGVGLAHGVYIDGVLAGFTFIVVSILPHNGIKVATAISLFIATEYRNTDAWTQLKAGTKTAAALVGCELIFWSAIAGSSLEKILDRSAIRTNTVFAETLS